jgi:hypothetical protein
MRLKQKGLLVAGLVGCCAAGGTLAGTKLASGAGTPPIAAFTSASVPTATDQADIQSLAGDLGPVGPNMPNNDGAALTGAARDLISNAGPDHEALGAFPTSSGEVCFEVLAAGTCGKVDGSDPYGAGIVFSILSTRDGGTHVYGVAADKVVKVDVEIDDTEHPATLSNNGFYYALPDGVGSSQIQNVIATWTDGSVHEFPVHA